MAKPVHAFVGPDSFLQTQKLAELMRQVGDDVQRIDVDGESAELSSVLDELRSFAMFGGSKVVVVRNADEFLTRYREQLENYCEKPSDSAVLVLRLNSLPKNQRIYKIIARSGTIEACEPPKDKDIPAWIVARARAEHKLALTGGAASILADLIGADLGRLDNELAKLAIAAENGKIDEDQIKKTIAFQRDQEMYDLTNELASGKPAEALRRWRQLIQMDPSAEFRAVTWLGMWLEDIGSVLSGKRTGRMAEVNARLGWKYKGPRFNEFLRTAERLGEAGYARAVQLLAQVDYQSKSGVGDAAENVERFILSIGIR